MVKRNVFDEVVIADINLKAADNFAKELNSSKVSTRQVDVLDMQNLVSAIKDADLVVNCTGPYYLLGPPVVKAAITAGKNYIDFCDDIAAHEEVIKLDQEAKNKGLTILVGLGVSPGLCPLIVMDCAGKMDEVEEVNLPQLINNAEPEGPAVAGHMIANFFGKVPIVSNGKRTYKEAFTDEEEVDFGPPLGKGMVSPFGHPEIFTLLRVLPNIKNISIKIGTYPVEEYEAIKFLSLMGLGSVEPLNVKGQSVVPRDFLISLLMARPPYQAPKDRPISSSMVCEVKGKKDGKAMTVKLYFNGFMGPSTGLPCALGAEWIVQGKISRKGVVFPEECIDPKPFLDEAYKRIREISSFFEIKEETIISQTLLSVP
jgi:saccharopine dehydrogenase-like NADP-dependent oxidoreductase